MDRHKALDLMNTGSYKEAEPLLREIFEQVRDQKNAESFMWGRHVAETLVRQGKFAEGEPFAHGALKGFENKYGSNDEDTLDCKYLLAESLSGQKKYLTAKSFAQSALKGLEANLKRGPEHHTTLSCRALIALMMKAEGEHIDAKVFAQNTLETLEVVELKAEILASQGSRRLCSAELLAMQNVKDTLAKAFNLTVETSDKLRRASKETLSTYAPESVGDLYSRRSSKASIF